MTPTSEQIESERRGAPELLKGAAVVSGGVLVVHAAELIASTVANFGLYTDSGGVFGLTLLSVFGEIAFARLPFAVGILLTLWLVRPAVARSSIQRVIGTGAIAALGGGILLFVVQLAMQIVQAPNYSLMGRVPGVNPFYSVTFALNIAITSFPLVILGVVLLWLYLRRRSI
ncbi:hypothetical protein [Lacisediminihabitans changchengi]|uniref:Uncharacterized protein n=1 Tax=Lacisediminihabitans changchengi TaxID=2787634 RepID=A0A934SKC8_9MICO|nr:hypothetical protein [Lacisediminihabitans changchengi]MBK4346512.1 hypothetical protein [Lacisediminihabitans changchengi]